MQELKNVPDTGTEESGDRDSHSLAWQFFIHEALSLCLESPERIFGIGEVPPGMKKAALDG